MTDTLDAQFITSIRKRVRRRNHAEKCFLVAGGLDGKDRQDYFEAAIKQDIAAARAALMEILSHGPDADLDDPGAPMDQRAQAAYWLLHFQVTGLWDVTPTEKELASAFVTIHFGQEATPMKTKADLAREAGLPTEDMVFVKAPKKAKSKPLSKSNWERIAILEKEGKAMKAVLSDLNADAEAKLHAAQRYLNLQECLMPEAHRAAMDHIREKIHERT